MFDAWVVVILLTLLVLLAAMGLTVAACAWHLAKRARLAPGVETGVPIGWVWSPRASARLHRRLQAAVRLVQAPAPAPPRRRRARRGSSTVTGADVVTAVTRQAVLIDRELLAVIGSRPQRRAHLRRLERDVRQVEQLAARIRQQQAQAAHSAVPGFGTPTRDEALAGIAQRLDILDQANAEVAAVEADRALLDPDEVLRRITPTATTASPPPPPPPATAGTRPPPPPGRGFAPPAALPSAPLPRPGFTASGHVVTRSGVRRRSR